MWWLRPELLKSFSRSSVAAHFTLPVRFLSSVKGETSAETMAHLCRARKLWEGKYSVNACGLTNRWMKHFLVPQHPAYCDTLDISFILHPLPGCFVSPSIFFTLNVFPSVCFSCTSSLAVLSAASASFLPACFLPLSTPSACKSVVRLDGSPSHLGLGPTVCSL